MSDFIKLQMRKAASVLTAVLLCVSYLTPVSATGGSEAASLYTPPALSAHSAILLEADSGNVITEKNADVRMSPASTTKIMTALVAIEQGDIEKTVAIHKDAVGIEGSSVYLYEGERLTLSDLLYAMLLESANDAAAAIAIEVSGSIEAFADLMNQKATSLGLENTHFENPHGLDAPEHYTTARELALIARAAMQNATFREIVGTYKKTVPLNETEGVRLLMNHNKLLRAYKGCIGIKTGYTKKSGRCLVSAANRDGVELIAVTLNAPDDWQDHKTLFDFGFSLYESRTLLAPEAKQIVYPVIGGKEAYVLLTNREGLTLTLPKNSGPIKCRTELFPFTYAPVRQNEPLGRLVFYSDADGDLASVDLVATYSVDRIVYKKSFWDWFLGLFR